jgi:Tol biopolymer transport system component
MLNSKDYISNQRFIIFGTVGVLFIAMLACNVLPTEKISSLLRDLANKMESPETQQNQEVEQEQAESSETQTQVEQPGNSSTEGECTEFFGKIIYEKTETDPNSPDKSGLIIADETGEIIFKIPGKTENLLGFGAPAWSPNHCRIAFNATTKSTNGNQTGQTEPPQPVESQSQSGVTAGQPQANQPQSQTGAFIEQAQSNQTDTTSATGGNGYNIDIYAIDPDGTDIVRLTDSPRYEQYPDWSPDGKQIVYVSGFFQSGVRYSHLWVMNADGSDQQLLSDADDVLMDPEWSPDGKKVVFNCHNPGSEYATGTMGAICVIDADGKNFTRLMPTDKLLYDYPAWSPDGKQIAIMTNAFNRLTRLGIMNADGSGLHEIPLKNLDDPGPMYKKWSSDGKKIIFEQRQGVRYKGKMSYNDIFIINLDNGDVFPLTQTEPALERYPDW